MLQLKNKLKKTSVSPMTLLKEIKDLNKCRDIPCSWFGRLSKMSAIPNQSQKNPTGFMNVENYRLIFVHMEIQKSKKSKAILKNNNGGFALPSRRTIIKL